jgi:hypothetical protein
VADSAAGASEVTVHISLLEEAQSGPRADEVRELLDRSLDRLADEVQRRVSDAS